MGQTPAKPEGRALPPHIGEHVDVGEVGADKQRARSQCRPTLQAGLGERRTNKRVGYRIHLLLTLRVHRTGPPSDRVVLQLTRPSPWLEAA